MTNAVLLSYPFRGRWLTRNSPASRVPSHGTTLFGTSYAIDFVPVDNDGRSARITMRSLVAREHPRTFIGFGRDVLAPIDGTVVAVYDSIPDHAAYRGIPSLGYALTQSHRARKGWLGLAGNHVMIESDAGPVLALCHLQLGSIPVAEGQRVRSGDIIGRCGNSGNSTEPHLHLQAIDRLDVDIARAVPITFDHGLPRNGQIIDIDDSGEQAQDAHGMTPV